VSEQQAEETRGESGSVGAGSTVSHSSEAPAEAAAALAVSVLESPAIAPDHEAPPKADMPKADMPKADMPKADMPKADMPKADMSKADMSKADAPKVETRKFEVPKPEVPRATGKVLIMAPSDRAWHDHSASAEVKSDTRSAAAAPVAPKRGFLATAAMLALAVIAGAIGGAVATTGFIHVADAAAPPPGTGALEASITRIDADVAALKAGLDHTSKQGVTQFSKTNDRLDKIEKAQAEPAAKLAKLTEAVDKLRAAPAATPATVAAAPAAASAAPKDITGSITPQAVAVATSAPAVSPVAATPPKPDVGRLPSVEGWSLTDVGYGGAVIRNRRGTFEVYAGDYVPGLGRIDAIRKQDGQWVVVTSKGLIVRR
jgi:hypothetical protein